MSENDLNEMWQEMTDTPDKRLAIAGIVISAMLWHHKPGEDLAERVLHDAVVLFENSQ